MPQRERQDIDCFDLIILWALYTNKSATATSLEKILNISRATISDRLKRMVEMGILAEPEIDISANRLRKIYHTPGIDILKQYLPILDREIRELSSWLEVLKKVKQKIEEIDQNES